MFFINIIVKDYLLLIEFNCFEKMNVFNWQMFMELVEVYIMFEDDFVFWCGFVYVSGEYFIFGLDFGDVGFVVMKGDFFFFESQVDFVQMMGCKCIKLVVFVVKGYCFIIGIEIMLVVDIVVVGVDICFG